MSQNWKSQNKVGVAEEIGFKSDIALSKIGQIERQFVKNLVTVCLLIKTWNKSSKYICNYFLPCDEVDECLI